MSRRILLESLIGKKFFHLTITAATRYISKHGQPRISLDVLCDCGKTTTAKWHFLRCGKIKSCGCSHFENIVKHGHSRSRSSRKPTPEYMAWQSMIRRCTKPNNHNFEKYGGRGIRVCERWMNSFSAFLEDVGPRTSNKHSLGRIDNNGHYEPGNVRWETQKQQQRNRRSNKKITFNGETLLLVEWAEKLGMRLVTLTTRLRDGMSIERALTMPVRKISKKK